MIKRIAIISMLFSVSIFSQWTKVNNGISTVTSGTVGIVEHNGYLVTASNGQTKIFRSADNGDSWSAIDLPSGVIVPEILFSSEERLFLGYNRAGGTVIYSSDFGASWNDGINCPQTDRVTAFIKYQGDIYVGTAFGVVSKSTDDGSNWVQVATLANIRAFHEHNGKLYAATVNGGIYRSTDNGNTWENITTTVSLPFIRGIWTIGNNLYFTKSTLPAFWYSTDDGDTWQQWNDASFDHGYNIYRGINYGGTVFLTTALSVMYSQNQGGGWTNIYQGLPAGGSSITGFLASDNYLFVSYSASLPGEGIYRYNISTLTSVESNKISDAYYLSQNYPNPFNPSTKITFSLPESMFTTLGIFDSIGNEIAMPVKGYLSAGTYNINFEGSALPSGIYFYRIESGNFIQTRKMLLLK